jgi:hypothetical protein
VSAHVTAAMGKQPRSPLARSRLLNAFVALADDLRTVMGQIAWGKAADRLDDFVRYGADRSPWCAQLKTASSRT